MVFWISEIFYFLWYNSVCSSIPTESPADTTLRPQCEGFTCPNTLEDGGLFPYDENECSRLYCDCTYGKKQEPRTDESWKDVQMSNGMV